MEAKESAHSLLFITQNKSLIFESFPVSFIILLYTFESKTSKQLLLL